MKNKIAVIGLKGLPAYGGAATVGEHIIENLKDSYDFIVYSTSSHTSSKTGYNSGYYQIVFKKLPFKKLNTLYYYIISAFHALLLGKYDIVHLHHRDAAFILLILKLKYKVIITTHSSFWVREKWKRFSWFFQANERLFVKKADIVTCVSKEEKRAYKREVSLETIYIPNGIDLFRIDEINNNSEYEPYIFFGAGRIIESKGLDLLLIALHKIKYEGKLVIAGDLDQMNDYKSKILKLSEGLNIDFLGMIKSKRQLLDIISKAKFYIFPSSMEAMSMMLLEAASTKCPGIISDIIQNQDLFNTQEALFFKSNDSDDLARKLIYALENEELLKNKAELAFRKLENTQQWIQIAKQYDLIYKQLL